MYFVLLTFFYPFAMNKGQAFNTLQKLPTYKFPWRKGQVTLTLHVFLIVHSGFV